MRFLKLSLLALLLSATATGAGAAQEKKDQEKKPEWPTEVGGKKAEEWIKTIAQSDRSESEKALKTILLFGPDVAVKAVPVILGELKKHKGSFVVDASFRANAPSALAMIMAAQEKPDEQMIRDIIDTLRPMLRDPQIVIRYRALLAVTQFGSHVKEVKAELILNAGYPETHEVRQAAIKALAGYPFDRNKEVPPTDIQNVLLKQGLKDPASSVRLATLHTIEALNLPDLPATKGPVDEAVTLLLYGTSPKDFERNPQVRIAAHLVAYGINKAKNENRRKDIAFYLSKKDSAVRIEALHALKVMGSDAKDQAYLIIPCLKTDQDPAVRLAAFQTLSHIGGTEKQCDTVFGYAEEKEPVVRASALQAVGAFGKVAKKHVPAVAAFLKKEKEELPVKMAAVQALGHLGPIAKGQEGLLLPLIDGKQEVGMRVAAVQAVGAINPKAPAVWKKLLECLGDKEANVVGATGFALGRMGKDAVAAVPALRAAAKRTDLPAGLRAQLQETAEYISREANPTKKAKK